jgi:hypothetical protein
VFGRYNATDKIYRIEYDDREIEIIFKALDSPSDVRDLLSLELTGAHVDEAREIHQDVIKGLLGRVGRFPSKKDTDGAEPFLAPPQVLLTTNYPSTEHWLYSDFVENPISGYTMYQQSQEENKHNLPSNYYENLELDYARRPDLLKTLVRGEWGITVQGKQVFPEFSQQLHIAKESLIPKHPTTVIRGWDNTGLSPAICLSYINALGQWCIFKEFCYDNTGIMEAAEAMILWCRENLNDKCEYRDIADPAGKNRDSNKMSPADYIRKKGHEYGLSINLEDGIQTFKTRRESMASRLTKLVGGQPALLIDPKCTKIINGLDGGYAFKEIGGSGVYSKDPIKNEFSHIIDACMYISSRLFTVSEPKPVKTVSSQLPNLIRGGIGI